MNIILGSGSQRRKDLLALFIDRFDILVPGIDETPLPEEGPVDHALRMAEEKSAHILTMLPAKDETSLVITSDTIVVIGDTILGKPAGYEDAFRSLRLLSGKRHRVISAMTLALTGTAGAAQHTLTSHEITTVTFNALSRQVIEKYLSLIDYSDKAGAYAVQEHGSLVISGIDGSESNVIGFPARLFLGMLFRMGLISEIFKI